MLLQFWEEMKFPRRACEMREVAMSRGWENNERDGEKATELGENWEQNCQKSELQILGSIQASLYGFG